MFNMTRLVSVAAIALTVGAGACSRPPASSPCWRVDPVAMGLPAGNAAAVRSNEHRDVWMVAVRLDADHHSIGVWAVDHLQHPTRTLSVNGVAERTTTHQRAADVAAPKRLPRTTRVRSDGVVVDRNSSFSSWAVGITVWTHGARDAFTCVTPTRTQ